MLPDLYRVEVVIVMIMFLFYSTV